MTDDTGTPITLGDKLTNQQDGTPAEYALAVLISAIIGFLFWRASQDPVWGLSAMTFCVLVFAFSFFANRKANHKREHFLFYADQQGFMKSLELADKTAIFDGSNVYHFGQRHGVGIKPLKTLVQHLRADGYRIICFFDANIYFTLLENAEFKKDCERFPTAILQMLFELKKNEIYIVPARIQADRFIVETLSHLPKSFAVTNDRYRDYEAEYDFLSKDKGWRKGVKINSGNLLLYQYSFKQPLKV